MSEIDLEFIKGLEKYYSEPYQDPPDVWKIGHGCHRLMDGRPVNETSSLSSPTHADNIFAFSFYRDYLPYLKTIPTWDKLNTNQQTAIASFAYGEYAQFYGTSGYLSITELLNRPKTWDNIELVANTFKLYNYRDGKTDEKLTKRREKEAELFLTPIIAIDIAEPPILDLDFKKITAIKETWLKKDYAEQAADLDQTQKAHCNPNKSYLAADITETEEDRDSIIESGHIYLQLSHGAGTWFVYQSDWQWEGERNVSQFNLPDAIARQFDRLNKYAKTGDTRELITKVAETKTQYFSQRDNSRDRHRTCNTSSNAMYLDWLLRVCNYPGLADDSVYLPEVFKLGDTIYHGVQTEAIHQCSEKATGGDFILKTKWMSDADLPFIKNLLKFGFPVVCNIKHRGSVAYPRGGHVIMLIAYSDRTFTAHDPYGTLLSNYKVTNGAYSKIPESHFIARWEGGYRILA